MTKRIGHGVTLYRDVENADITALVELDMPLGTKLASVRNITPPTKSRDKVDFTDLESAITEYKPTDPPDVGELQFDVFWKPTDANAALIDTVFDSTDPDDNTSSWTLAYPFTKTIWHVFNAFILTVAPAQIQSKEAISRTVTLVLTSKIHEIEAA